MKKYFKKNIFIEGMQGSGKTTLLETLSKRMDGYRTYREGDISPVELAWCSYLTQEQYDRILCSFPELWDRIEAHMKREDGHCIVAYTRVQTENAEFYRYMEQFEIYNGRRPWDEFQEIILRRFLAFREEGNLFECSFLQNIVETMLLYYELPEEEILTFYRKLFSKVDRDRFVMVYLDSEKMEDNLKQARKERVDENGKEVWYELMLEYVRESPYGRKQEIMDGDVLIRHLRRRRKIEKRIIDKVLGDRCIVVLAKEYDTESLIMQLEEK